MSAPTALTILHVDEGRDWRGGQQQIGFLVDEQRRAGHAPWLLCPEDSPLAGPMRERGIPCVTFATGRGRAGRIARGAMAIRRLIRQQRPDVVHGHNPAAHTMIHAGVPGGRRPLRVVTRRLARVSSGPWSRVKYRRGADVFIAVSSAVERDLVASGAPPERIVVARSAIDPERYASPPPRREALATLGLPAGARIVGSLGSLVRQKAHVDLIDAFARLTSTEASLHLVIVGEGPLRAVLQERARHRGVSARVHLTGFRPDLESLVPHMDVMAFPSLYEGMPNAVLDALAAGVPVVATPAGGTPEVIEDGVGGLLVPFHSPARLAMAMAELLHDRERAVRLAAAGRERVLAGHLPRVMAARTEDAYRMGLAGVPGQGTAAVHGGAGALAAGSSPEIVEDLVRRARVQDGLPEIAGRDVSPGVTGRGGVRLVSLGGVPAVLKKHWRGGLPGRVLGRRAADLWLGLARVRREHRVTRLGRARGAPFPAPLGWLAVRAGLFRRLYSAAERVRDPRSLGPALLGRSSGRRTDDLLAAVGAAVARQHHAGVRHGDLNLGNILREGQDGPVRIIDLVGARCAVRLGAGARARDLVRLERSALKLMGDDAPPRSRRLRLLAAYLRERRFLEETADHRVGRRALLRAVRRRRALFRFHGVRG